MVSGTVQETPVAYGVTKNEKGRASGWLDIGRNAIPVNIYMRESDHEMEGF